MNVDEAPQFVDTNVLIYAHDASAGDKHERARELVRELWQSDAGCLSVQVLQEFYVNVTTKVPKPLSPDTAADRIAELAMWTVHRPNAEDVLDAIRLSDRYQITFWDAMIVQSAEQLRCRRLWTEDLSAGQLYGLVQAVNPFTADSRRTKEQD